ncbi:hypothetical protein AUJ68_00755 [Candidatus Woesearchaeota archaeon CG1_02_57_44]|nr:MAG: hypothetical protein AUJ68_00755 [Candidatus Woesearchaeota archaeon CG1_02_57_44]
MSPSAYLAKALPIVQKANAISLRYFRKGFTQEEKGPGDVVTQADKEIERFLIEQLGVLFPGTGFLGEEYGAQGSQDLVWVMDPIDGTANFSRGLEFYCTSVALVEKGVPIVGMVINPVTGECFSAAKGCGANLNDMPIRVSDATLRKSMVVDGLGLSLPQQRERLARIGRIAAETWQVRILGAIALEMAYIAAGRLDIRACSNQKPWDVAAGAVLVQEAGGKATDFAGSDWRMGAEGIVASNGTAHDTLLGLIHRKE